MSTLGILRQQLAKLDLPEDTPVILGHDDSGEEDALSLFDHVRVALWVEDSTDVVYPGPGEPLAEEFPAPGDAIPAVVLW